MVTQKASLFVVPCVHRSRGELHLLKLKDCGRRKDVAVNSLHLISKQLRDIDAALSVFRLKTEPAASI